MMFYHSTPQFSLLMPCCSAILFGAGLTLNNENKSVGGQWKVENIMVTVNVGQLKLHDFTETDKFQPYSRAVDVTHGLCGPTFW